MTAAIKKSTTLVKIVDTGKIIRGKYTLVIIPSFPMKDELISPKLLENNVQNKRPV